MPNSYDILDYGACPDGKTVCTHAIQQAIDACHKAGGGRVSCGPGTFVSGSLKLKSRVELYVSAGCRITGSQHLEDYAVLAADGYHSDRAPEKSSIALLWAVDAENVAISGSGTIDGAGLAFYKDQGNGNGKLDKPDTPRPRIGMFYRCHGLRIQDTTFIDSACWTLWLMQSEKIRIHGITIEGNRRMRNVDGIDIDACRDVVVSDCRIDSEDDCLVLRAIQQCYDAPAVCENVVITNCILNSGCQGVRIGCPRDGIIRHGTLSNLVIHSTGNGILCEHPHRYFSPEGSGSAHISHIMFSNVIVNCRGTPIKLLVEEGIALQRLSDFSFSDFRITGGNPCLVQGCPQTIIRNIKFNNLTIETSGADAIRCCYCEGVHLTNVELSNQNSKVLP